MNEADKPAVPVVGGSVPATTENQPVVSSQPPVVQNSEPAISEVGPARRPMLAAALHHTLLWFFSFTTTMTLGVLVATLFGYQTSAGVITSFVATSLVSLAVYGAFYLAYLKRYRKDQTATTGRIWPAITIVIHSLAALSGLVAVFAAVLASPQKGKSAFIVCAVIVIWLNLLIVAVYALADFASLGQQRLRRFVLTAYPIVLALIVGGFAVAGLTRVGPLKHDADIRGKMVKAAGEIRHKSETNRVLPKEQEAASVMPEGVEYELKESTVYRLCADFQAVNRTDFAPYGLFDMMYYPQPNPFIDEEQKLTDSMPLDSDFANDKPGRQCFDIESSSADLIRNEAEYNRNQGVDLDPYGGQPYINLDNNSPEITASPRSQPSLR